jgi:hypothetical protein
MRVGELGRNSKADIISKNLSSTAPVSASFLYITSARAMFRLYDVTLFVLLKVSFFEDRYGVGGEFDFHAF